MAAWWKTDRLHVLILNEVRALWERLATLNPRDGQPPDGLRVEEHVTDARNDPALEPRLRHVWYLDDDGLRLVPGLRSEPFDPGAIRGVFFQFGLVRFQIVSEHARVVFGARLGPNHDRDAVFEIVGAGEKAALVVSSGTLNAGDP